MGFLYVLYLISQIFIYILVPYICLLVSYRLILHPLAGYPGPFWGKISDGYGGLHAALRRLHLITYENHITYGSVVRQGPNRLVFNTVEALQDIYLNPRVDKSSLYSLAQMSTKNNIFDTVDVREHRRKRKIISQAIAERSVRMFEPTMSEQIDIFIKQLTNSCRLSEPINISKRCMWLGGDIVGHLAFGYPLEMQTDSSNRWLQSDLSLASARINVYMQAPIVRNIEPLLRVLFAKAVARSFEITSKMIRTRLALDKHAKRDLYSFAADHMTNSESLEDSELWPEAFFFIIAGGKTTATVMSAMFFYLSRYPKCYKKLAGEVRANFHAADEIQSGEQLRRCDYLRACINETLRLSPPNTGTLWRQELADDKTRGPLVVDGHVIPPGTELGVNMYSIHHNPKYFPEPFAFRPERWLESSADQLSVMQKAWAPFTVGAHSCPGKAVAYLELSLIFARTFWYFDFEAAPGDLGHLGAGKVGSPYGRDNPNEYQLYDTFSAMHDGPVLVLRNREATGE